MVHKRTLDAKEKYEGAVFKTNNYGDVEVTEYIDSQNITVKFLNTGAIKNTTASALTTGILKTPKYMTLTNMVLWTYLKVLVEVVGVTLYTRNGMV